MPEELLTDRGQIDYRKLKLYCSDQDRPMIERLQVFDLAFNRNYAVLYGKLPGVLQAYLSVVEKRDSFKIVRCILEGWVKYTR